MQRGADPPPLRDRRRRAHPAAPRSALAERSPDRPPPARPPGAGAVRDGRVAGRRDRRQQGGGGAVRGPGRLRRLRRAARGAARGGGGAAVLAARRAAARATWWTRWPAAPAPTWRRCASGVDRGQFDAAVALLAKGSGKIGIFGHRKSAALAEYAYYLLNPLLLEHVADRGRRAGHRRPADRPRARDRLIAFTFRRYAKRHRAGGARASTRPARRSVLITDDLMAPGRRPGHATCWCARRPRPGEFDTAAPGMVLVEALAAAIASRGRGDKRRDLAERLWKQFGTY